MKFSISNRSQSEIHRLAGILTLTVIPWLVYAAPGLQLAGTCRLPADYHWTVTGNLTLAPGAQLVSQGNWDLSGDLVTDDSNQLTIDQGVLRLTGVDQQLSGGTYAGLECPAEYPGTRMLTGSVAIQNDLLVGSGVTLDLQCFELDVAGTSDIQGEIVGGFDAGLSPELTISISDGMLNLSWPAMPCVTAWKLYRTESLHDPWNELMTLNGAETQCSLAPTAVWEFYRLSAVYEIPAAAASADAQITSAAESSD